MSETVKAENTAGAQGSPEGEYLQHLRDGTPKVQGCLDCGRRFFYPRTHCTYCRSDRYEWVPMDPAGTLYSFSNIPAQGDRAAYNVVLVDMADGFRMMSTCPDLRLDMAAIAVDLTAVVDMASEPPRIVFQEVA